MSWAGGNIDALPLSGAAWQTSSYENNNGEVLPLFYLGLRNGAEVMCNYWKSYFEHLSCYPKRQRLSF